MKGAAGIGGLGIMRSENTAGRSVPVAHGETGTEPNALQLREIHIDAMGGNHESEKSCRKRR